MHRVCLDSSTWNDLVVKGIVERLVYLRVTWMFYIIGPCEFSV